ncbi:MAG: PAS domain-containing hybrid sensor histidine kinase/response regulator [Gemmataceae bacterium]
MSEHNISKKMSDPQREWALQKALAYADDIIATLREPFVVLDGDLRVKTANRAFYDSFHATKEKTENRLLYELGEGQWNIASLRTLLAEILQSKTPSFRDFEVEHDFPVLGMKTMLLNARRFPPDSKHPELILLAIEDITAHKQAAVAVQTSEVRYRRLFETARDGILILDAKTLKIIDANPFMTEMLGYSRDEFMGKELWEIGLFGDKQASQAAYEELKQKGYIRYDHLPLQTKDGKRAEVEFVSNVYQVDHRPIAQCNIRDIGERSRLERKTHEQAEALADLHRRKDEFLAMLSHELRNPLAPISNAVQLLRLQRDESGLQQRARTIIERQLEQLVHLVDDLLEVSRISTGRIHLQREQLDMRIIVERGVETARPLIEQRRHALDVHLPPSPIWIDGDATRLEQVVVNLLNNAAKYTDEGGHIWLSLQQEGTEAVLQVRDSGVGIAPDLMPRIFTLFTQAERSLARSQGGLGIGLALVQRLVEMHEGRVEASSAVGKGSEFVVRLPMVLAVATNPPSSPAEDAQPTGPSLRVLVVDDNVDAAESLALLMSELGHEVRTAHDGPSALEAALECRPNVVLLDIGLPGLDGYEVAKRMRQQPVLQNVVLAAMTGYGKESDCQRAQEAGFDHHLVKPAKFEKVQQILASVSEKTT